MQIACHDAHEEGVEASGDEAQAPAMNDDAPITRIIEVKLKVALDLRCPLFHKVHVSAWRVLALPGLKFRSRAGSSPNLGISRNLDDLLIRVRDVEFFKARHLASLTDRKGFLTPAQLHGGAALLLNSVGDDVCHRGSVQAVGNQASTLYERLEPYAFGSCRNHLALERWIGARG